MTKHLLISRLIMISTVDIDEAIERRLEIFAAWGDCATWRNLANAAGLDPTSRKGYNQSSRL